MTRAQILARFPNASESVLSLADETFLGGKIPNPEPQRHQAPALGKAVPREATGLRRTLVRFTGYRVRPLDPDNFAGSVKDLLDGLRHAGILQGDEPWRIKLETEQEKVGKYSEEKTIIEITEL
jgi:hypothetical protein